MQAKISLMEKNFAFIDSQNLNLGIRSQGWHLDFKKFKRYLKDKYRITRAFLFIGYIPSNEKLYTVLRNAGYTLVFKPTVEARGETKGNVDAELVLQAMHELCQDSFDKAVIVSGDGDFHCLANYLHKLRRLRAIVAPARNSCSSLLTKNFKDYVIFLEREKKKVERKMRP